MASTLTEGVEASLAPWLTAQADPQGNFKHLTDALAAMGEQVYAIVADQGSPDDPANYVAGWSSLLDPDTCPTAFLPYCSMFNGTGVPPGTDDAEARAIIKAEGGFGRGTPAAIVATARRFLTGTQSCMLIERQSQGGPDPYHFLLIVRPEEVLDAVALTAAVEAVKPAGVQWTPLVETDGEIWAEATRAWSADTTTWAQKG